jgi:hypothetical protein
MPGAVASNLYLGSRSEMLADYFFGTFGPVTPVRGHDDYGLDLYCAFVERIGQRSWAREYFSVQVKSTPDPWAFEDEESVRWLVDQRNPIFLCVVDKKAGALEVFHTFGRFAMPPGRVPSRLVLKPGVGDVGSPSPWDMSGEFDLSAPIIRASCTDFFDEGKHDQFRAVLAEWLGFDRLNLDFRRMGISRYRMPDKYSTNVASARGFVETGWYAQDAGQINRGILRLADAAHCLADQLQRLGDMRAAVRALLLLDHLRSNYPDAFKDDLSWQQRVPGALLANVVLRLKTKDDPAYVFAGLDAVQMALDELERVAGAIAVALKHQ